MTDRDVPPPVDILPELRDAMREIKMTCIYCFKQMRLAKDEDGRESFYPVWECPKCKQRIGMGMMYPEDEK